MRGDRLRIAREKAGLTQDQLADTLKRDIKQVWRWENDKASPSADNLGEIAKTLGVSADYLIGITDDPNMIRSSELTEDEHHVVKFYRELGRRDRHLIANLLIDMTSLTEAERAIESFDRTGSFDEDDEPDREK